MPGTPTKTYDDYPDAGQFVGNENIPLMQSVSGVRKVRKASSSVLAQYLLSLLPNNSCLGYRNAALSLPNNAWTDIQMDAEDWDGNNLVDLTSGALGPLGSGVWQVSAQVQFGINATGVRGVAIRDVDGNFLLRSQVAALSATRAVFLNLSGVLKLSTLGLIWLQAFQDSGAALALTTGRSGTWFGMHLYK